MLTLPQLFVQMVLRSPRTYLGLFCHLAVSVAMIFAYGSVLFHPAALFPLPSTETLGLKVGSFAALIGLSFFALLYSVGLLYKEREMHFGMYRLLGMTRRQLQWLIGCETAVVGFSAIGVGVVLGFGLSLLSFGLMRYLTDMSALTMHFSFPAFFLAVGAFVLILLLLVLFSPYLIREQRILTLLQGERRPKPAPLTSRWHVLGSFLSFAGLVSLCCWGSVRPEGLLLGIFSGGLSLTLVGLYLFYTQGGTFLARRLAVYRPFAWRGGRILWLREMAHRLRDNARLFYVLTLAILLGWLGMGAAFTMHLIVGELEAGPKRSPYQAIYTAPAPGQGGGAAGELPLQQRLLEQKLATEFGISSLQRVEFFVLYHAPTQREPRRETTFISAREYEKVRASTGGPKLELAPRALVGLQQPAQLRRGPQLPSGGSPADMLGIQPASEAVQSLTTARELDQLWVAGDQLAQELQAKAAARDSFSLYFRPSFGYLFSTQGMGAAQIRRALLFGEALQQQFATPMSLDALVLPPEDDVSLLFAEQVAFRWEVALLLLAAVLVTINALVIGNNVIFFRFSTDLRNQSRQYRGLRRLGVTLPELRRSLTVQIATFLFLPFIAALGVASCFVYYYFGRWLPSLPSLLASEVGPQQGALRYSLGLTALLLLGEIAIFLLARQRLLRALESRDVY